MVARRTLATSRPTQERLLSLVRANPGIHIRRLAQLTGMSWNTCLHHLRTMESDGTVAAEKVEGRVCYFDKTQGAVKGKAGTALLRDQDNRRLMEHIMASPGQKQVQIATALELATSTVHRRVARLEGAGLVERMPGSRSMHVFPSELAGSVARASGMGEGSAEALF